MTQPASHIGSVAVVGDGVIGLLAAIALRRALPRADITLIQLPLDPSGWLDRLGAASPVIHKFHRQIGLDPRLFVRRAAAEPVHLRRHERGNGDIVREASTAAIPFVEGVALHQIWLRHRAAHSDDSPDFAAMLLALRDARNDEGGFGARFDIAGYRALLDEMAVALKIARRDAGNIDIETDGDAIKSLVTAAGEALVADLYVDAAGPQSRLLAALGVDWRNWSAWLPSMGLRVTAERDGVSGEESLRAAPGATMWRTRRWRAHLSRTVSAPAPGRIAQSWKNNVVAIGEAAVRAPVIDGARFGLAIDDILRLVALLPRPDSAGRDRAEYIRRSAIAHDALADWSSLCLVDDEASRPASLADSLSAFDSRGRIARPELDPIQPGEWLARLMTLRPAPRRIDPTALALPDDIVRSTIARARAVGGPKPE